MKNKKLLGIIAVILASICYGVMPIFSNACLSGGFPVEFLGKLFGESIPAYMLESPENALSNSSVVAFSMGFGCIISLIVLASKRKLSALKVKPRELMSMSLYGGVAFFATCLLLTYAYQRMDKGSAIVLHFSYPAVSCIAYNVSPIAVNVSNNGANLRKNYHFSRKLLGTVSKQSTCYPAPRLFFTHLRSDLKKFEKLSFFDFFRILI